LNLTEHRNMRSLKGIVGIFFIALISANASANQECDALHTDINHNYLQLDRSPADDATKQRVNEFAKKLDGRWFGEAIEVICGISNGTTHAEIKNFKLDAEVDQHHDGSIIMRAHKENGRKLVLDRMTFSPEVKREMRSLEHDIESRGAELGFRSYEVSFPSENTMVFDEKYLMTYESMSNSFDPSVPTALANDFQFGTPAGFRRDDRFFTNLVHEEKTVKINNDKLDVNRDVYVNGHFISSQKWTLDRTYF